MSRQSPYKTGLGSQILSRARLILGSLLLLLTVLTVAGLHQGVTSGDFKKFLSQSFKTLTPTPAPIFSPPPAPASPTPSPAVKKTVPPVQPPAAPVLSNCIKANIREGEFASNKCYSQQDYEDLNYYLGRYASAKFDLSSAEGFMKIDCGAAQTFEVKKADCEKDQQDKAAGEAEVAKYRNIIQGIIAKGR